MLSGSKSREGRMVEEVGVWRERGSGERRES
jgi:hypothetical protein